MRDVPWEVPQNWPQVFLIRQIYTRMNICHRYDNKIDHRNGGWFMEFGLMRFQLSVYVYVYVYVYMYMYICIYVYMYICIYVYMYICICMYIYHIILYYIMLCYVRYVSYVIYIVLYAVYTHLYKDHLKPKKWRSPTFAWCGRLSVSWNVTRTWRSQISRGSTF